MKRLLLFAGALLAGGVVAAPVADAAPVPQPCGEYFCPCDERFTTPLEADAWTTGKPVVISPHGTARIFCHDEPAVFDAYQLDPDGTEHQLYSLQALSSSGQGKVYVWNSYTEPDVA